MESSSKAITKYTQKDADRNFLNWMKACLIIKFVKEGITKCVDTRLCTWHHDILYPEEKGQPCSGCTTENVLPCKTKHVCVKNKGNCRFHNSKEKEFKSCSLCKMVKDAIVSSHAKGSPSWMNTQANRWSTCPWEVAKCFMPPNTYVHVKTAAETDLNGILGVIINHKAFRDIFDVNECEEIRTMVNKIRHAPDLLLTEEELRLTINRMTDFLSCNEHLKKDETAKGAIKKIEKIKSDQLPISTSEISSMLQEVIEKNTKICQNMNSILRQAIETLETERAQELETLEQIFSLLKEIRYRDLNQTTQKTRPMTETDYQNIKQEFKSDLIKFNDQRHSSILLSPLFGESDTRLVDFYVFPKMEIVDNQQVMFRRVSNESRRCIASLHDMFYMNNGPCREIYVTSESGVGKSVFCKRLSVTWCHSHQSYGENYFSDADLKVLQDYDFLFLILLRDSGSSACQIQEMIQNQIIQHLDHSNKYTTDVLEEILSRESCLIILDGLDEWSHDMKCKVDSSNIPHRKSWEHSTILTTSRPWKFNDLNLKTSQVDRLIEIQKLDKDISDELTLNTLSKLNEEETSKSDELQLKVKSDMVKFNTEIENKSIRLFTSVPLILTYVICLWHVYGKSLGCSKCEIYSNILGLLLNEAEQRQQSMSFGRACRKRPKLHMPKQIATNEFCKKYYEFMLKVGRLAYETYFANDREKSFVFANCVARKYLTDDELKFCFEVGIMSQSKHLDCNISKRSKLSFREQTLQEFLAALYMQSVHAFSKVVRTISSVCNSVESILPVSNVLIFLSGLCPKRAGDLSKKLCKLASQSDNVLGYRSDMGSWNYFVGYNRMMKAYQSMHVDCLEEFQENFIDGNCSIQLYLEDYFIDTDFKNEKYSKYVKALFEINKTQIMSIKVRDIKSKDEFNEIMDILKRNNVNSLEKIDIKCEVDENDIDNLLACSAKSLKCFILKGGKWENNGWRHSHIVLSEKSLASITNAKHLEVLYLRNIEMAHHQIEILINHISNQQNLKHIGLSFLKCIDHSEACKGVELNLQNHAELKMLEINAAPFSKIEFNTKSLEVCFIGLLEIEGGYSSVLRSISEASKLRVFFSGFMKNTGIEYLNELFPLLINVQQIWLTEMDLGEINLAINTSASLEKVFMMKVKMTCKTFQTLSESLKEARKSVRIGLFECCVVPESKFIVAKDIIRKSGSFSIELDGNDENGRSEFLFRTIPGSSEI